MNIDVSFQCEVPLWGVGLLWVLAVVAYLATARGVLWVCRGGIPHGDHSEDRVMQTLIGVAWGVWAPVVGTAWLLSWVVRPKAIR